MRTSAGFSGAPLSVTTNSAPITWTSSASATPRDLPLGSSDADILRWTERKQLILVTFDKATLPQHLVAHLQAGNHCPGVFMLRRGSRLSQVVSHLALVAYASEAWEWRDRIEFIPY